jgi:hypothetical protein
MPYGPVSGTDVSEYCIISVARDEVNPEDRGDTFLRNVGYHVQDTEDQERHLRRRDSQDKNLVGQRQRRDNTTYRTQVLQLTKERGYTTHKRTCEMYATSCRIVSNATT